MEVVFAAPVEELCELPLFLFWLLLGLLLFVFILFAVLLLLFRQLLLRYSERLPI